MRLRMIIRSLLTEGLFWVQSSFAFATLLYARVIFDRGKLCGRLFSVCIGSASFVRLLYALPCFGLVGLFCVARPSCSPLLAVALDAAFGFTWSSMIFFFLVAACPGSAGDNTSQPASQPTGQAAKDE